ncbi:C-X-C chemokine receptor type 3-like isoform X2 [Hoplias malabaricus]|uniref:C-X-C chemokine receptor type 3-like isoform X2 n=1 Tax=Hoplias malabaricus TaxID=27720 RepID=UPI0034624A57
MANVSNMELDLDGFFQHNSTFDYGDYEYIEEKSSLGNFEPSVTVFVPVLYAVAMVVGLLSQGLVLVILWQKRLSWSVTDILTLHMSIADVLLLLTVPLWAVEAANEWIFGLGLCKLSGALFKINFYFWIFLLVSISVERYLSIFHGVKKYTRTKPVLVHLSCLVIWILSLLLSVPDLLYLKVISNSNREGKKECAHLYLTKSKYLASRLIFHIVGFLLPVVVLLICLSCIFLKNQKERDSRVNKKQRGQWTVLSLVVVFFIFWTPYNIALLINTLQGSSDVDGQMKGVAVYFTAVVAFLQCCLKPFVYFSMSCKFRHWVLKVLRCGGCSLLSRNFSMWHSEELDQSDPQSPEEKGPLTQMSDKGDSIIQLKLSERSEEIQRCD